MKKFLSVIAAFALCLIFAAGCGDYSNQTGINRPIGGGNQGGETPGPDETAFKASLVLNGEKYVPDYELKALWSDGISYKEAVFGADGIAKTGGLDGEYRVTLSGLIDDYTYNPNIYYANNDKRDVQIELFELGTTSKMGKGNGTRYNEHVINYDGYYRATFTTEKQAKDGIYFLYKPLSIGKYSVESIIDVTANDVNPILDIYVGTFAWSPNEPDEARDEGGSSSNFTKNFRYDVELKSVGNVYRFAVRFNSRGDISLPVNIDFYVKYEGETDPDNPNADTELITDFDDFDEVASKVPADQWTGGSKTWKYAYVAKGGKKYLYGDRFGFNEADGLWHVLNEDGTFGAVLLAKINKDSEVLATESGQGFLDGYVRCGNLNGKNYERFVQTYAGHTDPTYGSFPVTQRVKEFLQDYAVAQRYFMDGRGWAEGQGYMSEEEDQWLFNCGYLA